MNRIILSFLLALLPLITLGQNHFKLNSIWPRSQPITVNGDSILIDSSFTTIETNYPFFDTITLHNNPTPVICNFQPDSLYSLIGACCGTIDVAPSWKVDFVEKNDLEIIDNSYQPLMLDRPTFTLKVINNKKVDSIYGWYMDHACFPSFRLLTYESWDYGSTQKCFYWNNISDFEFFKSSQDYSEYMYENEVIEDWYPYPNDDESVIIEEIGSIRVRLFDNHHYTIVYDAETSMTYLEN